MHGSVAWWFVVLCGGAALAVEGATVCTDRPVIGIIAQASSSKRHGDTLISANYIKCLEQAGARVVPIRVRQTQQYYEQLFSKINGALFPGGHVSIVSSDYSKTARIIYDLAVKANSEGEVFPLWGSCEGFQLMTYLSTGHRLLHSSEAYNVSLPLILQTGYETSRMLGGLTSQLTTILTSENVTPNFHHYGVSVETYNKSASLRHFFRVLSTNRDNKGKLFVSTAEAYKYPFYGTQWHPEKINFEWNPSLAINHGANGVLVSQYFANFFVNEARRSCHQFPSDREAGHLLIEKFFMNYWDDGSFKQIYYFNFTQPVGSHLVG
ncbi:gamma-glutamyl hydrolase-like [Haliotis cracherodii]|uniref:gamma-glutamyl hydrolase-like n=1 Tax=Haliotis cracherodii TaxID=6455 RepID=UPI0039EC68ED